MIKKNISVFSTITAATTILLCAVFLAACELQPVALPSPATPTPAFTPSGWAVYTNTLGFSFQYPADVYHVDANDKGASIAFSIPGMTAYQGVDVMVYPNDGNLSLDQYLYQFYADTIAGATPAPPPDLLTQATPLTVGGLSALKTVIPSVCAEFMVFIPYRQHVIALSLVRGGCTGSDPRPETLALFDQMLQTFVFNQP